MAVRLGDVRFLVVDSDPELRILTRDMLDLPGILQVCTIGDGSRTFAELHNRDCGILILDRLMESVNGIELTRMIRMASDSPKSHIPILMVTLAPSLQDVTEARDAGVSEFLIRPFSIDNLKGRLLVEANNPRQCVEVENYFGPDRRRVDNEFHGKGMRGTKPGP